MKKIIILSVFIGLVGHVLAQNDDNSNKNEISINLFSLSKTPDGSEEVFNGSLYHRFFTYNIKYKRLINNKNAVRFIYYRPTSDGIFIVTDKAVIHKGYNEKIYMRLGYERIFAYKRFLPYVAMDVLYLKSTSYEISQVSLFGEKGKTSNKNIFGGAVSLGIDYKISNNVCIGIESDIRLMFVKEEKISDSYGLDCYCYNLDYLLYEKYVTYTYSPLSLDLKILF